MAATEGSGSGGGADAAPGATVLADSVTGLPCGTASAECARQVSRFMRCVLLYGDEWAAGAEAAKADPDCVLAQLMHTDYAIAA